MWCANLQQLGKSFHLGELRKHWRATGLATGHPESNNEAVDLNSKLSPLERAICVRPADTSG
jgi:hypothetical protein